jgi:Tol biopolymer transport system component
MAATFNGTLMDDCAHSEVRAELELVLANPRLARSERLGRFLRFIVEEELSGRGSQLKEYIIGVEVYHKPVGYDPRVDSTVRVEASRLRQRLAAYYLAEGSHDPIIFTIPKGNYHPVFTLRTPEVSAPSKWSGYRSFFGFGRHKRRVTLLAGIGLAAVAIAVALSAIDARRSPSPLPGPPARATWDGSYSVDPVVSADGKFMVYASDRGSGENGFLNLWRQDMDDSPPRRLTTAAANHTSPAISPDGKEVLFHSNERSGALFVTPADGGAPTELHLLGHARDARYSPVGRWIAFWAARDEETQDGGSVHVFDRSEVAPVRPQRVLADFAHATRPIWSADGRWLLILGTWRSQDDAREFDAWAVPMKDGLAAGVPVKTGLLPLLKAQGIYETLLERRAIVVGDWVDGVLYVSARRGHAASLWRVRLDRPSPKVIGPAEQLDVQGGSESGARVGGGRLVYANREIAYQMFRAPLSGGDSAGSTLSPVTNEPGLNFRGTVSQNAQRIVFESKGAAGGDRDRMLFLDIATGQRREIGSGPKGTPGISSTHPLITPEGDSVAFRVGEGTRQAIYLERVDGGDRQKICNNCGAPLSWTGSGPSRRLVYETGGQPTRIGLLDVSSGRNQDWIAHPSYSLFGARPSLSHDGNGWVLLYAANGSQTRQILIAPVSSFHVADWREWIAVTDGARWDIDPAWGPGGKSVYFISHRDGHRCIWMQPLDARTKYPAGPPAAAHHFHSIKRTLMQSVTNRGAVGLTVANNRLFFALDDRTSSVWVSRFSR